MKVKLDTSGLDRARKQFKELAEMKQMPVSNWLTDQFVRANTDFKTAQEMIDASGIESAQDEVTEALDRFIITHSNGKFSGWEEMKYTAFAEYVRHKLES